MNVDNAWFLITSEEIEAIMMQLQDVRDDIPDKYDHVRQIQGIINTVRNRLV
ncbi:hypothetical protein [Methanoregula sp.]|uniref:hypothetical protein n=1 Tax=Methanoregula sp. TaxID=2052170 RepID=UPI00237102BB|nr:hypothetical protein [Methanoregula sp.]MDD1687423.1 hypothetical protein [Methanoregula sp.]